MSTRSNIAKLRPDGTYRMIYCHSDGYPSHNGRILLAHYEDEAKIDALLDLGDISELGAEIGVKHAFDWRRGIQPDTGTYLQFSQWKDQPEARMCLAYGRDRGEVETEARSAYTREACHENDYSYIRENGVWLWSRDGETFAPLTPSDCLDD